MVKKLLISLKSENKMIEMKLNFSMSDPRN